MINLKRDFNCHHNLVDSELKKIESSNSIAYLPQELILQVFSHLNVEELGRCRRVNREWHLCASDESLWKKLKPEVAFGRQEWFKYFGDCGVESPLPANINQILKSPCPFWPDKKVEETHVLVLIPPTIDGKPLTLMSLEELVKKPKEGPATQYSNFWNQIVKEHGQQPDSCSRWALMTKDVIPGSRAKSYAGQQALLKDFNIKSQVDYAVPSVLEAAICVLMHYVKTQERLLSDNPKTCTRCQEKVDRWQFVVGDFSLAGLVVFNVGIDIDFFGLAPVRLFL